MGELKFKLSRHVREETARRSIPLNLLESVLEKPEQVVSERAGKKAYQSQVDFGSGKIFLVRAIVDETVTPPVVVTVYRTRKITKYWRNI